MASLKRGVIGARDEYRFDPSEVQELLRALGTHPDVVDIFWKTAEDRHCFDRRTVEWGDAPGAFTAIRIGECIRIEADRSVDRKGWCDDVGGAPLPAPRQVEPLNRAILTKPFEGMEEVEPCWGPMLTHYAGAFRPAWVRRDDLVRVDGERIDRPAYTWTWPAIERFALYADHRAYRAIEKGLSPWGGFDGGDPMIPSNWSGGPVLLGNGDMVPGDRVKVTSLWAHGPGLGMLNIIGYPLEVLELKDPAPGPDPAEVAIPAFRQEFTLSGNDSDRLRDIVEFNRGLADEKERQHRINQFWTDVGARMGFIMTTVDHLSDIDLNWITFTAEACPPAPQPPAPAAPEIIELVSTGELAEPIPELGVAPDFRIEIEPGRILKAVEARRLIINLEAQLADWANLLGEMQATMREMLGESTDDDA